MYNYFKLFSYSLSSSTAESKRHVHMESLRWVGSWKWQDFFSKVPYKRVDILQKRLMIFKEATNLSHPISLHLTKRYTLIERNPPPRGGVSIYYAPWSRVVSKRFYDEMRPSQGEGEFLSIENTPGGFLSRGDFFQSAYSRATRTMGNIFLWLYEKFWYSFSFCYGVAMMKRLLEIVGLFCSILSLW